MPGIDDVEFIQIEGTGEYFDLALDGHIIGCIWAHETLRGYYQFEFDHSIYDVRHYVHHSTTRDIDVAVERVLYWALNHSPRREIWAS